MLYHLSAHKAERILILAPKNVCDQWQIALRENFLRSRGLGL
jgi:hypothetical protein